MSFVRTRIKADKFVESEKHDNYTILRWDATKEIISIPSKKKGGEPTQKESDWLVCTEGIYRHPVAAEQVRADIEKDLNVRYPEGNKPDVDFNHLLESITSPKLGKQITREEIHLSCKE